MTQSPQFLGKGLAFPLRIDATGTKPEFSANEDLVFESIEAILNTDIGERPHRVKNGVPYGTRFRTLLFSNVDAAIDLAMFDARRALETWEPRIIVLDVRIDKHRDANTQMFGIVIQILFRYRATNRVDNFVNFYKTKSFDIL